MPDRPVEILALPGKLHELFDGLVPHDTGGDATQQERDFLSRALCAYVAHKLGGASCEEAAQSIVDGGGDGGIDGVFYSPATNTLWVTQSKYIHNGMSEPDLGDVTKFKTGVENLLEGRFEIFADNAALTARRGAIEAHLKNASTQVRAVLCYSGLGLISEDRKHLFETLTAKVSLEQDDEYFRFQSVNLTTLNDWVTGGDTGLGIDEVDLEIGNPGYVAQPYETIYGLIALETLKALYSEHGKRLVRANIRGFKGSTEVNDEIRKTLAEDAGHFHYFNNGLTAYCDRLELNNLDRTNAQKKRITAKGFAIINGAQTLGSIGSCVGDLQEGAAPCGYAFIKIVSLEKCEDERAFADRISRTANFQNHVVLRDFAAAYPVHEQMSLTLEPHDIHYHYKMDEDTPANDDENFTIEESLTACACLKNSQDCDLVTRVAANRQSLLSLDMIYPPEDILRSRHERVFPPDLSARTVWRAVQTQRLVLSAMSANARAATGVRKAFYTNAKWIVLTAILNRLKTGDGEELALSEEERNAISTATNDYANTLLQLSIDKGFASYDQLGGQQVLRSVRDFQSIFKQQADCQTLFAALKAQIWQPENQAPPATEAPQGDNG